VGGGGVFVLERHKQKSVEFKTFELIVGPPDTKEVLAKLSSTCLTTNNMDNGVVHNALLTECTMSNGGGADADTAHKVKEQCLCVLCITSHWLGRIVDLEKCAESPQVLSE
jgi:hypothetical protein